MTTQTLNGTSRPITHAAGAPDEAPAWNVFGICSLEPELFFPSGNSTAADVQERRAKEICGNCRVRTQCLEWALETGQDFGVLGGLTDRERRELHGRKAPWYEERGRSDMHKLIADKGDELLALMDEGLKSGVIAERLGVSSQVVGAARRELNKRRGSATGTGVAA
ncbi:WhiB family transcriptional regulator [Streptomyces sp. NPDC058297]|uniref:WhiB family transcriptional regulator n=1 Tax=Streptomyces sp. NPDC058297 TaxID=3346433 RepID=UPI0036EACBA6